MKRIFETIGFVIKNKGFKWAMIILAVGMLMVVAYQAGKFSGFQDNHQQVTFGVGKETYKQSDVTHQLMQTDKGRKTYANYVLSKVMNQELKDNHNEPSDKQINNFAKQDANHFKSMMPTASAKDFEQYVATKYGSDSDYKEHIVDEVTRATYAKKYVNIDSQVDKIFDQLGSNAKIKTVEQGFIKNDDEKAVSQLKNNNEINKNVDLDKRQLSPYTVLQQFGKSNYDKYMNTEEGNIVYIKGDDGYYVFKIKDNQSSYTKNDLKKEMKNNISFYLDNHIQKKAREHALKYMKSHKDSVKFTSSFDYASFKQGFNQLQ